MPVVPPYFDALIPAVRAGRAGRHVHLGWWDDPPSASALSAPGAFAQAQARMDAQVLALAELRDGLRVLDVGCGFGATLAAAAASARGLHLVGINIDARQLALCRAAPIDGAASTRWLQADATALPLPEESIDRLLCVEAMFHFASRGAFLREAARVLVPGGLVVATDIVAVAGGPGDDALEQAIVAGFGPWPDLWGRDADPHRLAAKAGLRCTTIVDASAPTLPSHAFTAPPPGVTPRDPLGRATAALAALHRGGRLHYPLLRFEKPA